MECDINQMGKKQKCALASLTTPNEINGLKINIFFWSFYSSVGRTIKFSNHDDDIEYNVRCNKDAYKPFQRSFWQLTSRQ